MSTGLSDDASAAYHRFRHEARLLGSISSSFDALATSMTAAFYEALDRPHAAAWTTLVARTELLVRRVSEVRGVVPLDAEERAALDFFTAVVRENDDLLSPPAFDMGTRERAHHFAAV